MSWRSQGQSPATMRVDHLQMVLTSYGKKTKHDLDTVTLKRHFRLMMVRKKGLERYSSLLTYIINGEGRGLEWPIYFNNFDCKLTLTASSCRSLNLCHPPQMPQDRVSEVTMNTGHGHWNAPKYQQNKRQHQRTRTCLESILCP